MELSKRFRIDSFEFTQFFKLIRSKLYFLFLKFRFIVKILARINSIYNSKYRLQYKLTIRDASNNSLQVSRIKKSLQNLFPYIKYKTVRKKNRFNIIFPLHLLVIQFRFSSSLYGNSQIQSDWTFFPGFLNFFLPQVYFDKLNAMLTKKFQQQKYKLMDLNGIVHSPSIENFFKKPVEINFLDLTNIETFASAQILQKISSQAIHTISENGQVKLLIQNFKINSLQVGNIYTDTFYKTRPCCLMISLYSKKDNGSPGWTPLRIFSDYKELSELSELPVEQMLFGADFFHLRAHNSYCLLGQNIWIDQTPKTFFSLPVNLKIEDNSTIFQLVSPRIITGFFLDSGKLLFR